MALLIGTWTTAASWRDRLILAAPFLGVALLMAFAPSDDGPTVCPFALCTGMACPGCGMTRAAGHLIRGNLSEAMGYHPLIPLIAIQVLAGWAWLVLRRKGKVGPLPQRMVNAVLITTAAALLLVWVARILTGSLPPV